MPARIVAFDALDAIVEVDGRRRRASMVLQPSVVPGDWALIAAGTVIRRLDVDEARELAELLAAAEATFPAPGGLP